MEIDDWRFSREVSIRICGSLEIDKALMRCFVFVRQVMPVDELQMVVYERELRSSTVVAVADCNGGRACWEGTPIPSDLCRQFEEVEWYPRTRMVHAFDDPIISLVARRRHWEESSLLVNRLVVEGKYVGAFVARAIGRDRYTDEHQHLWALVNEPAALALANHQQYKEVSRLKDMLVDDKRYLQSELRTGFQGELVGAEFGLKRVMEQVRAVAPLASPVLISGETGTGKEFVANAIHDFSTRCAGPLIKVNCGAIPENLIDSELFGHEKGSFTGAFDTRRGRFERADGGTIFLDEVSELPRGAQVRFLRVIQEKEIERVGGSAPMKIDARIVSATNRDLASLVACGLFREDLYFRLNVFPISLPPLRERKTDMPALVSHFIKKKCREMSLLTVPTLAPETIEYHFGIISKNVKKFIIIQSNRCSNFIDLNSLVYPVLKCPEMNL